MIVGPSVDSVSTMLDVMLEAPKDRDHVGPTSRSHYVLVVDTLQDSRGQVLVRVEQYVQVCALCQSPMGSPAAGRIRLGLLGDERLADVLPDRCMIELPTR